ncbi:MAG: uroporphyrinogen decarboxylase [Alphaproteobacteria bacterium]
MTLELATSRHSGTDRAASKPLLRVLAGEKLDPPPAWLMRQAGRYLPEYREVRAEAGSFMALCFDPEKAAEVTLQPIRRYGFEASILFADILTIPHAMGVEVSFVAGEGPKLPPIRSAEQVDQLGPCNVRDSLAPIYETVRQVRAGLQREGFDRTTLIGFAGAPFTVACYMVEGGGSKDFAEVRRFMYQDPAAFTRLMDRIEAATLDYLSAQIEAGAEVVKLFDSHAGVLAEPMFETHVIGPAKRLVAALKQRHPDTPVICFPRGAGGMLARFAEQVLPSALALDTNVPLDWADQVLPEGLPVQGNLDPMVVLAGGEALKAEVRRIRTALKSRPHIFNLGHGINKDTPPAHVEQLVEALRT